MRPANVRPKYDGITRLGLEAQEERIALYERDGGICQACGQPVAFSSFEIAHRIAKTRENYARWGRKIVDHWLNRAVAHSGACNSALNIGHNPGKCAELVAKIKKE